MNDVKHIYGGLGFASGSDLRLQKIRQTVQFSLKKLGYTTRISVDLTARKIQFSADAFSITLEISEPLPGASDDSPGAMTRSQYKFGVQPDGLALCVDLWLAECTLDDPEILLASLMIDLVRAHQPTSVKWLEAKAPLRSEDFLAIFNVDQTGHIVRPNHPLRRKTARHFASVRAELRANQTDAAPAGYPDLPPPKDVGWPDAQVALTQAHRLPHVEPARAEQGTSDFVRTIANRCASLGSAALSPSALKQTIINLSRREKYSTKH